MFDLEKALALWRCQFTNDRHFLAQDLDEMERHLRDQVQFLTDTGTPEADAFRLAVDEMGGLAEADDEYDKVYWGKLKQHQIITHELAIRLGMLKNYAKLAYRTLLKNRTSSVINIAGLSIAVACSIVAFLSVQNLLTLDHHHPNIDRTFLVEHTVERDGWEQRWGRSPMAIGPALEADFPQVERAVRIAWDGGSIPFDGEMFEELITFADVGYFDMFTFPMQRGTADALADPNAIILSDAMATKYFGDEDPMGQQLRISFRNVYTETFTVQGVAAPFPNNTSIRFGFLINYDKQQTLGTADLESWAALTAGTFVQLHDPEDAAFINSQLERYLPLQNAANEDWQILSFQLDNLRHPSEGAYMVQRRPNEVAHPVLVLGFIGMALFMLALSCFNYINISLGAAARRLKEIGLRKVMGSNRNQLIIQFMAENLLLCLLALVLGIVLAWAVLIPMFNARFVIQIGMAWGENALLWVFLIGLLAFVGVASGAYPAFYIASFQPVTIFRGRQRLADKTWFTRVFLTFQFILAFLTVIGGAFLMLNGRYQTSLDWGYQAGHTVVVPLQNSEQFPLLRDAALQNAQITHVAGTNSHIGHGFGGTTTVTRNGEKEEITSMYVGHGYFEALGLRLKAGRFFEEQLDNETALVVNTAFATAQGWDNAVGQSLPINGEPHTVVGVVEDFMFFPMLGTRPLLFRQTDAANYGYLVVRTNAENTTAITAFLEDTWRRLYPEQPFDAFVQTDVFDDFYASYFNVTKGFGYLSALALLIACMGLFGLAAQHFSGRLKEVSVRKVLGASAGHVILLINRHFLILLLVAGGVASTFMYFVITLVLRQFPDFEFMPVGPGPFAFAFIVVFLTAALAIGAQVAKIVRANPAEVLRNE